MIYLAWMIYFSIHHTSKMRLHDVTPVNPNELTERDLLTQSTKQTSHNDNQGSVIGYVAALALGNSFTLSYCHDNRK